ncbi:MAG: hypothetical protein WCS37_19265, partial [Chloroflexota bacterium]
MRRGILAWLIAGIIGLGYFSGVFFNQPQLQFKYLPQQLADPNEEIKPNGFFETQKDQQQNSYSWTNGRATLRYDFQSFKPIKLYLEVESAAVVGGPDAPITVLVDGIEIGQAQPDPQNPNFQTLVLHFTPSSIALPFHLLNPDSRNSNQQKIEIVTPTFQATGDSTRAVGIKIKSITLDKSEAWSTIDKRMWLYWGLPLLILLAGGLMWIARHYQSRLAWYGAMLACATGASFMGLSIILLLRLGEIDRIKYWNYLQVSLYLGLLFVMITLTLLSWQPGKLGHYYPPTMQTLISLFTLYFLYFIYRTSFVMDNGERYFSLFDDAMISMRYAWNSSHGLGPVWNVGERVEGYTNPLMVVLMGLVTLVFDKRFAVLAVQLLSIGIMLGLAYLTALVADELTRGKEEAQRKLIRVLSFLGALSYYPLV